MSASSELYINEECRDEFRDIFDREFGFGMWRVFTSRYNNYQLSQLPKYLYVPILDYENDELLGMAIINNNFEIETDAFNERYIMPVPHKLEIIKANIDDKICMQCQPNFHSQTLHSPEGCIVEGCGCRLVNVTRKQV